MRALILSILISILFVLQSSFFSHLQLFGARPDLILGLVVAVAIIAGPREGILAGLLGGFLVDLYRGTFIGLSIPGKVLTGLAVGFVPKRVYADNLLVPIFTGLVALILDQFTFLFLGQSFGLGQGIWISVRRFTFFGAGYTALLMPFIVKLVKTLYHEFLVRGWYKEQRIS